MGVTDELTTATGGITVGLGAKIASYSWVLFPIVFIFAIAGIIVFFYYKGKKKTQWTHKLKVRRVIQGGQITSGSEQMPRLNEAIYLKMRRFPLISKAEVFELEKPLLGGYLISELDQYSGESEFSIILDVDNRIYTNKGEFFDKDKSSINVSAKHSEIDIGRANLRRDFQNMNKTSKAIEWAEMIKYAVYAIFGILIFILLIIGAGKWGDAQVENAKAEQAQAQQAISMAEAMKTMEAVVNTQKLELLPMWKDIYGTNNIRNIINTPYNESN